MSDAGCQSSGEGAMVPGPSSGRRTRSVDRGNEGRGNVTTLRHSWAGSPAGFKQTLGRKYDVSHIFGSWLAMVLSWLLSISVAEGGDEGGLSNKISAEGEDTIAQGDPGRSEVAPPESEDCRCDNTLDAGGAPQRTQAFTQGELRPNAATEGVLPQAPNGSQPSADDTTSTTEGGRRAHSQDVPHSLYTVGEAHNSAFGPNYGTIHQNHTTIQHTERLDLPSLLKPILDASHTRNLQISPPNSRCLPKTRVEVIGMVLSWARAGIREDDRHVMWIYGYAGCGKSAISLAVAEQLAQDRCLATSFFFFRGSGDRSRIGRLISTIASQTAASVPQATPLIEAAIRANPALLSTSTSSPSAQFEFLVFRPIATIADSLPHGPLIVVLDGVDECEDKEEVTSFIKSAISLFTENPLVPLRFLIVSRVEDRIHRELHTSPQVQLLNLVNYTSNADIRAALDVRISEESRGRVLACVPSWPSEDEKDDLVEHIGGSYIFMTTIVKTLFSPAVNDGLTPMDRLPMVLSMGPDFDELYSSLLKPVQHFPHFSGIVSTIALAFQPLSISQIAELLDIKPFNVTNVLINLHAIIQVPGDDHSPVTLWHTSLRDFLTSEERAGPFYAPTAHHQRLAHSALRIATSLQRLESRDYSRHFAIQHLTEIVNADDNSMVLFEWEGKSIVPLLEQPIFRGRQTALEVASRAKEWRLVCAIVNAGVNVNTQFQGRFYGSALRIGIQAGRDQIAHILLEHGADPNVKSPFEATPLHEASGLGHAKAAECLLKFRADPNARDVTGWTPLHYACSEGKLETAELLLSYNADPAIRNNGGKTAFQIACRERRHGVIRMLRQKGITE